MLFSDNNKPQSDNSSSASFHYQSTTRSGLFRSWFCFLLEKSSVACFSFLSKCCGSYWPRLKVRVKIGGVGSDAVWSQEECCLLLVGAWPCSAWRTVWRASCVWPLLLTASVDAFLHPLPGQSRIFHIVWIFLKVSFFQNFSAWPLIFFFNLFRLTN